VSDADPNISADGHWRWDGQQWVPNVHPQPSAREVRAVERDRARKAKADQQAASEFAESPAGRARIAFARGNQTLQFSIPLARHEAKLGAKSATHELADPNPILNAVADEGWRLVDASVVYLPGASASLNAIADLGSASSARGTVVGYYTFSRDGQMRTAGH